MPTIDEIAKIGADYLDQFGRVDFLGEIEIPRDQLDTYCTLLWKCLPNLTGYNEHSALLAAVVVNLAFYNRDELDSESFRAFVLSKLQGRRCSELTDWNDSIGPATLRVLKQYFKSEDREGPYRYVRPVMEQAGVSFSVLPQFVYFFTKLVSQGGLLLTHDAYQRFLSHHAPPSRSLRSFLDTAAGLHHCREVARILGNARRGELKSRELEDLPPRFRETINALMKAEVGCNALEAAVRSITPPQLALDKDRLQLKLLFAEAAHTSQSVH
jgi:hypothetical protein